MANKIGRADESVRITSCVKSINDLLRSKTSQAQDQARATSDQLLFHDT